ncbi:TonB-dependent receptor [candidate division KSB1 bacterium]|nr:TonB-dependent receptor [candidate division KSB1 bacterium]
MKYKYLFVFLLCFYPIYASVSAKNATCRFWGFVYDADTKEPLAGTNIQVKSSRFGTSTSRDGAFNLSLLPGRYTVIFSYIGYLADSILISVPPNFKAIHRTVLLRQDILHTQEVIITAPEDNPAVSRFSINAPVIKQMTSPMPDVLQTLKTMPGVTGLNDASSFYNVRGGNYDENLIYINGVEIYQPHTVLKGVSENPSLVNPLMVDKINLCTGVFPVYYGDKLSSVLDISYMDESKRKLDGTVDASTVGLNFALRGRVNSQLFWGAAVRKINYGYLFSGLQTKGRYIPDFTDVQAILNFSPGSRITVLLLTIFADSQYEVEPEERNTWRGNEVRFRYIFQGYEKFGYRTRLTAVKTIYRFSPSLVWEWINAQNIQEEHGATHLEQTVLVSNDPYEKPTFTKNDGQLNRSEHVNNRFDGTYYNSKMSFTWTPRQNLEMIFGTDIKRFHLRDDLFSNTIDVTSDGLVLKNTPDCYDIKNHYTGYLTGQFVHADYDLSHRVKISGGIRTTWSSLNQERLFLPRLQAAWQPGERSLFVVSTGRFGQPPVYKEMQFWQQTQEKLKAQTVDQVLAGYKYWIKKGLALRAEVFYKKLNNLISFDLDDVRIIYSGVNDAKGYAYGFDLQLRGQFLPNTDNWISYSYLIARENLQNDGLGFLPRPSDRRHMLAVYMEDRMPKFPNSKLHVRLVFGSGFPFTHEKWIYDEENNLYSLGLSQRNTVTLPAYKRVDIGFTQHFVIAKTVKLMLREQVLNVFNNFNTLDYDVSLEGIIPHRMSGRIFNIGCVLEF